MRKFVSLSCKPKKITKMFNSLERRITTLESTVTALQHYVDSEQEKQGINLLSLKEVSKLLHCSYAKIYGLVHEGTIPAVRIGKSLKVRKSDISDFLNANMEGNGYER